MATPPDRKSKKELQDLLMLIRERNEVMESADHDNRESGMADLKFVTVPGEQWDANMKKERGERPCYEFNELRPISKRVINDMRANRPQGKVRAVEGGDVEQAQIREGLVRNIWNMSDGDTVIDGAADFQVNAGMGAWRIITDYNTSDSFDQDIKIASIPDPFCLYWDPAARDLLKRDAADWLLTEKVSKAAYEKKYGKDEEKSDFEGGESFDSDDWYGDDSIRVAEYWYKKPHKKELWKMEFTNDEGERSFKTVDSESDEAKAILQDQQLMSQIIGRREVVVDQIYSCIASGHRILEGPTRFPGRSFPFVVVFGEHLVIAGKICWWGLPRFAKDAQRSLNVAETSIIETIAGAPKGYFWATAEQASGLTSQWADAHQKNRPWRIYNADAKAPGPPAHTPGADVPIALIQQSQMATDKLKSVTGIYEASTGQRGNETSGRAIYARQQQGEIATFNFQDNMSKGIKRTYEIVLDLIPEIYDTERELRVIGTDGAEDYVRVNEVVFDPTTGKSITINDMATGRYDVTVTIGPNFSTLRQESAEVYGQLSQQFPELMQFAGDLIFKSMDLPYAEDIAERLRSMLPPQIQESLNKDKKVPPEVQQMMAQAQQAMEQVQQHAQLVQAASAELEQEKALNEKQKAEIKTELANVGKAKAEFDANAAKQMMELVKMDAGLTSKDAAIVKKGADLSVKARGLVEAEGSAAKEGLEQVGSMDAILADFMQAVDKAMTGLEAKAESLSKTVKREPVDGAVRRENGRLVADVRYNDGTTRSLSAVRDKGELRIVPTE